MAQERQRFGLVFFEPRLKRFAIWFCCTTTLSAEEITTMLNTYFKTDFTQHEVGDLLMEMRRCRPGPKYRPPKAVWSCPQYFGFDCISVQRPVGDTRYVRHHFVGPLNELRCSTHKGVTDTESDSDTYFTAETSAGTSMETLGPVETQERTQNLLILLVPTTILFAFLAFIYFYNAIPVSVKPQWPTIKDYIVGTAVEYYYHLISLETRIQIDLDRPYLFLLYCLLFLMFLGQTNTFLSYLSPIILQVVEETSPATGTGGRWLSQRFPYFLQPDPTAQHRKVTLSNLRTIIKSFLLDFLHTATLFTFFYLGWLASKLNCPHIHTIPRNLLATSRQRILLQGREGWNGIFNDLVSYFSRCSLPNTRVNEFAKVGMMFMVCRYTFMVCFWIFGPVPRLSGRFLLGYRGE